MDGVLDDLASITADAFLRADGAEQVIVAAALRHPCKEQRAQLRADRHKPLLLVFVPICLRAPPTNDPHMLSASRANPCRTSPAFNWHRTRVRLQLNCRRSGSCQ